MLTTSGFAFLDGDRAEPQLTTQKQAGIKNNQVSFTSYIDMQTSYRDHAITHYATGSGIPIPYTPIGPTSCHPSTCSAREAQEGHETLPLQKHLLASLCPLQQRNVPLGRLPQAEKRVIQLTKADPLLSSQPSVLGCHCKKIIIIKKSINSVKTNHSYESVTTSAVLRITLVSEQASDNIYLSFCFSRRREVRGKGLSF